MTSYELFPSAIIVGESAFSIHADLGIAAYVSYKVTRDEVANLFDAELDNRRKCLMPLSKPAS